jgi:hypothetical protein
LAKALAHVRGFVWCQPNVVDHVLGNALRNLRHQPSAAWVQRVIHVEEN